MVGAGCGTTLRRNVTFTGFRDIFGPWPSIKPSWRRRSGRRSSPPMATNSSLRRGQVQRKGIPCQWSGTRLLFASWSRRNPQSPGRRPALKLWSVEERPGGQGSTKMTLPPDSGRRGNLWGSRRSLYRPKTPVFQRRSIGRSRGQYRGLARSAARRDAAPCSRAHPAARAGVP
jgi:hypothetical protein